MNTNWIEITCTRCKGEKYILGQIAEEGGTILPDYENNKQGECFACLGTGVLHLNKDNRIVRLTKTNILEYDGNGKYLGILEYIDNTDYETISVKNNIISLEYKCRRHILDYMKDTTDSEFVIKNVDSIFNEQIMEYNKIRHLNCNNIENLNQLIERIKSMRILLGCYIDYGSIKSKKEIFEKIDLKLDSKMNYFDKIIKSLNTYKPIKERVPSAFGENKEYVSYCINKDDYYDNSIYSIEYLEDMCNLPEGVGLFDDDR